MNDRPLAEVPLPADTVGLVEGIVSTRAIRRYRDEPVPDEVLLGTVVHGTPDDIARGVGDIVRAGAQHVQLTNMTPLCDPSRAAASEALLGDAVTAIRQEDPA